MSKDPAKTLELFFSITSDVVRSDLEHANSDIRAVLAEMEALAAVGYEVLTPEQDARRLHLQLVQASYVASRDSFAPEMKTFYAAFAAGHVAQDAEMIAADKDTCSRIAAEMEKIRKREGLSPSESWIFSHEGPEDFRRLDDEFGEVLSRVSDTIMPFVLRKYGLTEAADLFEQDQTEFEIQREIGRRVVSPVDDEAVAKMFDEGVVREYGAQVLARVAARAEEISRDLRIRG